MCFLKGEERSQTLRDGQDSADQKVEKGGDILVESQHKCPDILPSGGARPSQVFLGDAWPRPLC